jgi:hypothetical protein
MPVQERDNAAPAGRRNHTRQIGRVMLAAAVIAANVPAIGQGSLCDTTRILEYDGLECAGTANCKTFKAGQHQIDVGQSQVLTFQCPARVPYFVGWDTEQSEHLHLTVLPRPPVNTSGGIPATGLDGRLAVLAENVGPAAGHVTMYLGCSTAVIQPVGMMRQRTGVSSNNASFLGGN